MVCDHVSDGNKRRQTRSISEGVREKVDVIGGHLVQKPSAEIDSRCWGRGFPRNNVIYLFLDIFITYLEKLGLGRSLRGVCADMRVAMLKSRL